MGAIRETLPRADRRLRRQVRVRVLRTFHEVAESAPAFGDRRGYQVDPPNARGAARSALDVDEGADALMVKLAYLDVIRAVRRFAPSRPTTSQANTRCEGGCGAGHLTSAPPRSGLVAIKARRRPGAAYWAKDLAAWL